MSVGEERLGKDGYWENLWVAMKDDPDSSASDEWYLHRATASQRAKAFLLTMG